LARAQQSENDVARRFESTIINSNTKMARKTRLLKAKQNIESRFDVTCTPSNEKDFLSHSLASSSRRLWFVIGLLSNYVTRFDKVKCKEKNTRDE
jgi:hypothetical protein